MTECEKQLYEEEEATKINLTVTRKELILICDALDSMPSAISFGALVLLTRLAMLVEET